MTADLSLLDDGAGGCSGVGNDNCDGDIENDNAHPYCRCRSDASDGTVLSEQVAGEITFSAFATSGHSIMFSRYTT